MSSVPIAPIADSQEMLRNVVIHEYVRMDPQTVWIAVELHL